MAVGTETCSCKCAAGAAAQAPFWLTAGYQAACIALVFERRRNWVLTPCGGWFSHPTHR